MGGHGAGAKKAAGAKGGITTGATAGGATTKFVPQEIAYALPGGTWKRTIAKTPAALAKKLADLHDKGAQTFNRPLE